MTRDLIHTANPDHGFYREMFHACGDTAQADLLYHIAAEAWMIGRRAWGHRAGPTLARAALDSKEGRWMGETYAMRVMGGASPAHAALTCGFDLGRD